MTTKKRLIKMLMANGMFEQQAKEVMELAIPVLLSQGDGYKISFDGKDTDYPDGLYSLWFNEMKPVALKWIDENIPAAWYRQMFV